MKPRARIRKGREGGASLIVALIFLIVLAMLGVTVAGVSGLEERMASGTRDRDLALQAAEAALRDAETRLKVDIFRAGPFPKFEPLRANSAEFWEECFKKKTTPCTAPTPPTVDLPTGAGRLLEQPQFVIEQKDPVGTTQIFLVTARAVGGSADAIVVLQAEVGYTPLPPP
jgi:type IV pilus assembly protein PilX